MAKLSQSVINKRIAALQSLGYVSYNVACQKGFMPKGTTKVTHWISLAEVENLEQSKWTNKLANKLARLTLLVGETTNQEKVFSYQNNILLDPVYSVEVKTRKQPNEVFIEDLTNEELEDKFFVYQSWGKGCLRFLCRKTIKHSLQDEYGFFILNENSKYGQCLTFKTYSIASSIRQAISAGRKVYQFNNANDAMRAWVNGEIKK